MGYAIGGWQSLICSCHAPALQILPTYVRPLDENTRALIEASKCLAINSPQFRLLTDIELTLHHPVLYFRKAILYYVWITAARL